MDSHVSFTDVRTYISLPSHQGEVVAPQKESKVQSGPGRSMKESFTIKTNLCSTKLTQNSTHFQAILIFILTLMNC